MAWLDTFWDWNPLLSSCLSSFLLNILSRSSSCSVLIVPAICPALCYPQLIKGWEENERNGNIKETKESRIDWKWQRRKKRKVTPYSSSSPSPSLSSPKLPHPQQSSVWFSLPRCSSHHLLPTPVSSGNVVKMSVPLSVNSRLSTVWYLWIPALSLILL